MSRSRNAGFLLCLALGTACSAQADPWEYGHGHRRFEAPRHRMAPARRSDWVAPLVVLGVAGAALAASAASASPPPPPPPVLAPPTVYLAPPVYLPPAPPTYAAVPQAVVTAPAGVAYFCPAYGQYHPQVQACPGGWQLLALPR